MSEKLFNLSNEGWTSPAAAHQYATDPGWAYKQTSTIQTMYQMLSDYTIVYDVPAYK